jgi:N-sulfoglucosamine sulfohydrolase
MSRFFRHFCVALLVLSVSEWGARAEMLSNILLIVSEDNGPELGCYGDPYVRTPVLDRLATEGVRFANAYVPQAGCSQSRAALLTGLFPHQNGQIGLATWKFRLYRNDTPNLVRSLKGAGYRTGIIGKLHVNPEGAFPFDFKANSGANFSRKKLSSYAAEARRFMDSADEPFFLSVNYPDAHRPFLSQVDGLPSEPLSGADVLPLPYFGLDSPELREQSADYYNSMERLDSLIGDLLSELERSGKSKNTLVIYLGDHGADLLRGKRTSFEGGVRVPMLLRWPEKPDGPLKGRVIEQLVSSLDLMPTLLEVAGAEPVEGLAGMSWLPLLAGKKVPWRRYLYTEYHLHSAHNFYPQRTVRDERFKLICNLLSGEVNPGYEFTNDRFFEGMTETIATATPHIGQSYGRMRMPAEYELYDLQEDPFEFRDLVGDAEHAVVLSRLKSQLLEWRHRTKDPLLSHLNLDRLKREVEACFENGVPSKSRLKLTYPDYFFRAEESL